VIRRRICVDFVRRSPAGARYEALAGEIDRNLRFMSQQPSWPDPDVVRNIRTVLESAS
jgi:3-deoxy-D-arabino-heptulosonate 7-phosphate (DAHP) synthase class II